MDISEIFSAENVAKKLGNKVMVDVNGQVIDHVTAVGLVNEMLWDVVKHTNINNKPKDKLGRMIAQFMKSEHFLPWLKHSGYWNEYTNILADRAIRNAPRKFNGRDL